MKKKLLIAYGLHDKPVSFVPLAEGLINQTWDLRCGYLHFVLQKINEEAVGNPGSIAANHLVIGRWLASHQPDYFFVQPMLTVLGEALLHLPGDGYYQLWPYVEGSHSKTSLNDESHAYEAARQFGKFTRMLYDFDLTQLRTTVPDFHNLPLRYAQFLHATEYGKAARILAAADIIEQLKNESAIVEIFLAITKNPAFKLRVTHHYSTMSNVLFGNDDKGICVINLHTVMPGYFMSDLGDMIRTYVAAATEEEGDTNKIIVRKEYYHALVKGYLEEMGELLTKNEKQHIFYSGEMMTFMQALRFITDYLNEDIYYGASYEGHNLVRAVNQLTLLRRLRENKAELIFVD
jgi:hypothetical protein